MTKTAMMHVFAAVLAVLAVAVPASAHDWNDAQIPWQSYEAGLAQAKKSKKPICLIFFTEWCPHCKNYSGVFHDPKVAEQSKHFVMIHVDGDQNKELSQKYAPDGGYIPRTFFLSSNGTLADIHAPRDQYKYFYDEKNPASILTSMDAALEKVK
ncbi:MAG: thioredoxin family protein [Deltaproteobacteria bacterium]|nr:thioredoxin family protein [Deltaproteobacteria bacterium]MBI3389911.1 thioredoxin family protein [Deltaproteobacteria bacterium]